MQHGGALHMTRVQIFSRTFVLSELNLAVEFRLPVRGSFPQMIYLQGGDNAPFNKVSVSRRRYRGCFCTALLNICFGT
jgi:hypothetical protein